MFETNTRAFTAPMKYIQGYGELKRLETYTRVYGKKTFILIDGFLYPTLGKQLEESFVGTETGCYIEQFAGECSLTEIYRVADLIKREDAVCVVGVSGGKTLDAAKGAADSLDLPYIICPTAASNDAPVASVAVIYTDEGVHNGALFFKRTAELVLVDTEVVAKAPIRLFRAGIGDALATWYEAEANNRTDHKNYVGTGYRRTLVGLEIARLSNQILREDGIKAINALEAGVVTEAVENVIEANILMSGLGYQNTGCSVAHAVNAGLTELEESAPYLHGERVGFGVLVQFVFENRSAEEIGQLVKYMTGTGLPTTLEQVGVDYTRSDRIDIMVDKIVHHNGTIYSEPLYVSEDTVRAAILGADAIGRAYQQGKKLF